MLEIDVTLLLSCIAIKVSQRAFSRTGIKSRGDTSSWTDTPEQRRAKEASEGGYIGGGQAVLMLGR
jgi:hypothetical protein